MRSATRTTRLTALLLLAVVAFVAGGWSVPAATARAATTPAGAFVAAMNAERDAAGLPALAVDLTVVAIAEGWSGVMAAENRMYHNPALGEQAVGPWERLGENVGFTVKSGAASEELVERLHTAFMESEGHRANVLGAWTHVGVGVVTTPENTMWVTIDFADYPEGGAPSPEVAPPVPDEAAAPAPGRAPSAAGPVSPVDEAVTVSQGVFGDDAATHVVLARADEFADALGGAGLAGTGAPVLFTSGPSAAEPAPPIDAATRAEIDRVLPDGGDVYALGGTAALADATAAELVDAGYAVRRLGGGSRIETALEVAREVVARRGVPEQVLLARADVWADAISAGAYSAWAGAPVVLTPSDQLPDDVAAFLDDVGADRRVALGGSAALSDAVVAAAGADRVAGADRTATSVAIAQELWGRTTAGTDDAFVATPGYAQDGWAYALGHVAWSAAGGAPQLLVGDDVPAPVADYLGGLGYGADRPAELRASSVVPTAVVERARDLVDG